MKNMQMVDKKNMTAATRKLIRKPYWSPIQPPVMGPRTMPMPKVAVVSESTVPTGHLPRAAVM